MKLPSAARLTLTTTLRVGRSAAVGWQNAVHAADGRTAVADLRTALAAAGMALRKRGPDNAALGDDTPSHCHARQGLAFVEPLQLARAATGWN
ncbi:MAG: hypothetical protein QE285_06745 [Aquabacterium sp.]|nr:hypothetical protein [Aquabacterium sp.]